MKFKLLVCICVLLAGQIGASPFSNMYIYLGQNLSSFQDEASKSSFSSCIGVGYNLKTFQRTSLAVELFLTNKDAKLKNKHIQGAFESTRYNTVYDINCSVGSIDIPIILKYNIPFTKQLHFNVLSGLQYSQNITDGADMSMPYSVGIRDENEPHVYDYTLYPDRDKYYIFENRGFGLLLGFSMDVLVLTFQARYVHSLNYTFHTVNYIEINEKMNTLYLTVGIDLGKMKF